MRRSIILAKCASLAGFLVLVFTTYFLRSEVLELNRIRLSADSVRSDEEIAERKATYPVRLKEHEAAMKHYEVEMRHY